MSQMSTWFQEHNEQVRDAISQQLARTALFRKTANITTEELIQALTDSFEQNNIDACEKLFDSWFAPGTLPLTAEESLLSVMMDIQTALEALIRKEPEPLSLLDENQNIFRRALAYLAPKEISYHTRKAKTEIERITQSTAKLDKHKADFVSVAAHELKTPLTLIEGYAHMLKSDFPSEDYPRAAAMMKGILSGTQRLREIIEDMIDTSVIEMQMIEINAQPVWLARLIDIVITEMTNTAEEREISIEFDRDSILKDALLGDPERLYQVFKRIIENAIKFTPNGGKISISGRTTDDHMAEVMIQDTGIGLDDKDKEVIFEKFFSLGQVGLHSSSKSKFKGGGSGLGLAIAKGIVEAHGGKIWVESDGYDEDNLKGSCFHVALPMQREIVVTDNSEPQQDMLESQESSHPALAYPIEGGEDKTPE